MPSKVRDLRPNQVYGLTNPLSAAAQKPIIVGRPPQVTDQAFLGTLWIDPTTNTVYILASIVANQSNWVQVNVVPDPLVAVDIVSDTVVTNILTVNDHVNGILSLPQQPAFKIAMLGPDLVNATGDGTVVQIPFIPDVNSYDLNNNIDLATSSFNTPVSGVYHFDASVIVSNLNNTFTFGELIITGFIGPSFNPWATSFSGIGSSNITFSFDCYYPAATAVQLFVEVTGGARTVTVQTAGTYFNGHLVA